jgi:hypothetical protein
MYKYVSLFIVASMMQMSSGFAEETADKVYLTRKDFRFIKGEIVVNTAEGAFAAKAIHSDANGYYVQKDEIDTVRALPIQEKKSKKNWKRHKNHGGCKRWKGKREAPALPVAE